MPHGQQLLAWRERVGHVIDVVPSQAQLAQPFHAAIDRYAVDGLVFTDCRSDAMLLVRSLARISTDSMRDIVFHVFLKGGVDALAGFGAQRGVAPTVTGVLALDLDQPVRMRRHDCRVLSFFVPRATVETSFPDAGTIHGRVLADMTAPTRLLVEHVVALSQSIRRLDRAEAAAALHASVALLIAAFARQAGLGASARAASRFATLSKVRRHIEGNLHQPELSPDSVLLALQLSRPTLYRMFEQAGGLAAYIRQRRLREAADELVRFPDMAVMDIAYGLGFNSASDFTRAFRRAYELSPQELRAQAFEVMRTASPGPDHSG